MSTRILNIVTTWPDDPRTKDCQHDWRDVWHLLAPGLKACWECGAVREVCNELFDAGGNGVCIGRDRQEWVELRGKIPGK
jgi:hypothetical protein